MADLLNELRGGITTQQNAVLCHIWDFYAKNGSWIPSNLLYHKFSRNVVAHELQPLGRGVADESHEDGKLRYRLTIVGALVTAHGTHFENLLHRFLEYVGKQFAENPEIETIRGENVIEALHLDSDDANVLYLLLSLANWAHRGGNEPKPWWTASLPQEVDRLLHVTPSDFLNEFLLRRKTSYESVPDNHFLFAPTKNSPITKKDENDFSFIGDEALRKLLAQDWMEAKKVVEVHAWKSGVVLCGGLLEGMLLDVLTRYETDQRLIDFRKKKKASEDIGRWTLEILVDASSELELLKKGTLHLGNALREFRNLVHPGRQLREQTNATENEARIAIEAVNLCIQELKTCESAH